MKAPDFIRYALTGCVAAAMLGGCGGSQSPIPAPGVASGSAAQQVLNARSFGSPLALRNIAEAAQRDRGQSWMLPETKTDDLLYISNVYTVTVYSYPRGKHVGTLKGFYRPLGECSDKAGDIFIANGDTFLEYKHGGTKPIQTLTFTGYGAGSCGVDPTTGDLAATWDDGDSNGYVAVYQHASGTPTLYTNGNMLFNFCGYDNAGNLFVDGENYPGLVFAFAELPMGGDTLSTITLNQSLENAGAVQWDGKYVAVGDDEAQTIYRFTISGSTGTLEGTVSLGDAEYMYQWWIEGKRVVGSREIQPDVTWYWKYPAGGMPIRTLTPKGIGAPFGATISKAAK